MAKAKRQKPSDPTTIAARRAERREMEARGLTVNVDPRTEEVLGAVRYDCFSVLLRNNPDALGSVRWLEDLMRTASGENTQERRPDFIRGSSEGAPGQNVTQRMIDASADLEVVWASLRPWEAKLLRELLEPDAAVVGSMSAPTREGKALLTRWREVVERVTRAGTPQRQGERVVVACESLLWVRQNISYLSKAAA